MKYIYRCTACGYTCIYINRNEWASDSTFWNTDHEDDEWHEFMWDYLIRFNRYQTDKENKFWDRVK